MTLIYFQFKEIVQPKMKILSSNTYPHVVPNLCDFLWKTKEGTQKFFLVQLMKAGAFRVLK